MTKNILMHNVNFALYSSNMTVCRGIVNVECADTQWAAIGRGLSFCRSAQVHKIH